jgi:hypothetical protein
MVKPNARYTKKQLVDYIKKNKLNKPEISLSHPKHELISELKKINHWDDKHDSELKPPRSKNKPRKPKAKTNLAPVLPPRPPKGARRGRRPARVQITPTPPRQQPSMGVDAESRGIIRGQRVERYIAPLQDRGGRNPASLAPLGRPTTPPRKPDFILGSLFNISNALLIVGIFP